MTKFTSLTIFSLLLFILSSVNVCGATKPGGKSKADRQFQLGLYPLAFPVYQELLKNNPADAELNYKAGVCLYEMNRKEESISYLEKAVGAGSVPAYVALGKSYHSKGMFNEAITCYLNYKSKASIADYMDSDVDKYLDITLTAIDFTANPKEVEIRNLGPEINSGYEDYVPVISADESVLIFTSRRDGSVGGLKDQNGDYFEDLYVSYKDTGAWTKPANMGTVLNTATHDAAVGLSSDGQKLIIYRTNPNMFGGDLYISKLKGNQWSAPEKLPAVINSGNWEPSACLSSDEKLMYFTSNRPGGYGGRDIYYSRQLPDGTWGLPVNVGPVINTKYDEDAPFIHPDGKTLYFSSKGHKNMGGFDIFSSHKREDGLWSVPENLGYPVNTVNDDIYFVLSSDGKRGYFSSARSDGKGKKDLYTAVFKTDSVSLAIVKGKVATEGDKPVEAIMTVIDARTKEVQGIYTSNSSTGKYIIVLAPGKKYKVIIESDSHVSFSEEIEIENENRYVEIVRDFTLKKLK